MDVSPESNAVGVVAAFTTAGIGVGDWLSVSGLMGGDTAPSGGEVCSVGGTCARGLLTTGGVVGMLD